MANQYTGVRASTPLEMAELNIERLEREARLMQRQQDELLAMLKSVHDEFQSPDVARLLVIHGVDIDAAAYTTPRRLDALRTENERLRAENEQLKALWARVE